MTAIATGLQMPNAAAPRAYPARQPVSHPMKITTHGLPALSAEPVTQTLRRQPRQRSRGVTDGPLEAIFFDVRAVTQLPHGTQAFRFLSVDPKKTRGFNLLLDRDMAADLAFGGAYHLRIDYGGDRETPLVTTKPRYLGSQQAFYPAAILFDVNQRVLTIEQYERQPLTFARGEAAAAVLTLVTSNTNAMWQCAEDRKSGVLMLANPPKLLAVHSVVTQELDQPKHAMGLPVVPNDTPRAAILAC